MNQRTSERVRSRIKTRHGLSRNSSLLGDDLRSDGAKKAGSPRVVGGLLEKMS